jgi:hypothetical protein
MPELFHLYEELTVEEYLDFFAASYGVPRERRARVIDDVVELTDLGVRLIRQLLQQVQTGEPLLQYDRRGVPVLIDAFKGGYRMDDRGDKPKKDGFYDHPQDGERYGIINIFGATGNLMPSSGSLPGSIAYGSGG